MIESELKLKGAVGKVELWFRISKEIPEGDADLDAGDYELIRVLPVPEFDSAFDIYEYTLASATGIGTRQPAEYDILTVHAGIPDTGWGLWSCILLHPDTEFDTTFERASRPDLPLEMLVLEAPFIPKDI